VRLKHPKPASSAAKSFVSRRWLKVSAIDLSTLAVSG
jgi:hypothetical protein